MEPYHRTSIIESLILFFNVCILLNDQNVQIEKEPNSLTLKQGRAAAVGFQQRMTIKPQRCRPYIKLNDIACGVVERVCHLYPTSGHEPIMCHFKQHDKKKRVGISGSECFSK